MGVYQNFFEIRLPTLLSIHPEAAQCLLMDERIKKLWSIHTVDSREVYSIEMDSILYKYIYNEGKFYVTSFTTM